MTKGKQLMVHDVPVAYLHREVYTTKRNDECPAYTGHLDSHWHGTSKSVVVWQSPNHTDVWICELYTNGVSSKYWGNLKQIALWLFSKEVYPIFGELVDIDIAMIIKDKMEKEESDDKTSS